MAEDIHNEGSEEEKKDSSQQDEDFGLPDLEFEELEELDLNIDDSEEGSESDEGASEGEVLTGSDDIDMSVLDDIEVTDDSEASSQEVVADSSEPVDTEAVAPSEETVTEVEDSGALDQGIDEIEDVLDSAQLISDRLGDDDDDEINVEIANTEVESSSTEDTVNLEETTEAVSEDSSDEFSMDQMSTESVTGLTDEELEALMTPPEPVPDVESILGGGDSTEDIDDLLSSIDSPDDLAALGVEGDELPPEVDTEDVVGSSLFAADEGIETGSQEALDEIDMSSLEVDEAPADFSVEQDMAVTDSAVEENSDSIFEAGSSGGSSIFESDSIALDASGGDEKQEFQAPENASLPPNYKPYTYEEASSGNFAKVIVIGVVVISLIGLVLLYFHMQSPEGSGESKQVAKTEKPTEKKVTKPASTASQEEGKDSETDAGTSKSEEPAATNNSKETTKTEKPVAKEPVEKTPAKKTPVKKTVTKTPVRTAAAGEIIPIKERTGRVYAIIGSFIDEDIAMDYASELSAQGKGVKIIYPYGNSKNYRVTIADFSSVSEATSNIEDIKADYGDQVWALKY